MRTALRTLASGLPLLFTEAHAEERLDRYLALPLEELMALEVSISTESPTATAKAPAVVSVLTREDIDATGATNLVDILAGVPGVHVRANQFAFRPLVQFRGASARQTLLMIDGNRVDDLMWGFGIFWKGIPASAIDRVEVIRGPGSALFGADAAAGVVNVITRAAAGIGDSAAGARIGSFSTRSGWVRHATQWHGFEVGLTAEVSRTDGHAPWIATDAQDAADDSDATDVSYAPAAAAYGWEGSDVRLAVAKGPWKLLAGYVGHDDVAVGLTGAGVLDPVTRAGDSSYHADLLYDAPRFRDDLGIRAELKYRHLEYSSGNGFQERPPGYANGYPGGAVNRMAAAEHHWQAEVGALHSGFAGHAVRIGLGHVRQDLYRVEHRTNIGTGPDGNPLPPDAPPTDLSGTPYAFAPERDRHDTYLYLQGVWSLASDWELTLGGRYDRYSDFGSSVNPRLALVWQSSADLTSKLIYGRAFRAPSFQELYAETSFTLPNPDLAPERSETVELAFAYTVRPDLLLATNLFHFHLSDLIRTEDVTGSSKRQYRNTGDHTIRGIELEGRWQASDRLRFYANFTAREQDDSEFRAFDQPDRDGYLRVDYSFQPDWLWNLQGHWIGERERRPGDARQALDSYWLVDTTLRYAAASDLEYALSVRNLFDRDAREYTGAAVPEDLPLPERHYYGEVRFRF